ncbi:ABC transporter permease DevC [Nostoc favosum]|uniref:ABC transporter permease DevC n=1 Tax=Nostoc favosum CHAB5714 TaxID=2780399 RepID=A0ABS8IHG4_9NOSO|nr:ABC transporter permease DevC [Nostoc favosum]MCC5603271.1 ABC transporter permease DevC [Nostoc favosum CHAB5714]
MIKRKIPLAWLQLIQERSRLLVAIAGIAFADFLMFMQLGFQAALYDSNTRMHHSIKANLILMSPQAQNILNMSTFPRRYLYQAMSFKEVESTEALYTGRLNWKNPDNRREAQVLFLGFNPVQSVLNLPGVEENLQKIKLPDIALFDRASKGEYRATLVALKQGKPVVTEVQKHQVTVEGLFTLGASFGVDANVIVSDTTFLRLFPNRSISEVSVGLVNLKSGVDPQQMATKLQAILPNNVKVLTLAEFVNFENSYWAKTTPIGFIFSLGTAIGFLVGLVIVYQILYTDVSDHLAEYATLKAIGFSDNYFLILVMQEALILTVMGFSPGLAISLGVYKLAQNATLLPIVMTVNRIGLIFILTGGMCTIAGLIALCKLHTADPAEIF